MATLIIDNGAYSLKAGFAISDSELYPSIIPNCIARDREKNLYVGSQLSNCRDFSEIVYRRPVERGYQVDWEAAKEIWENEFFHPKAKLYCNPNDIGLILTEAPNTLPVLQTNCDQMIFEEFGFNRYLRCLGPQLNAYNDIQTLFEEPPHKPVNCTNIPAEILMLIDTGYSHTTITPLLNGRPLQTSIRRLDVGGKLLTNHLSRLLSIRNYDMTGETYVVNAIKEATCYVAKDFQADMEKTWKGPKGDRRAVYELGDGIAMDYVLPDYHTQIKGFARSHDPTAATKLKEMITGRSVGATEDIITLRNERFIVPEVLFNPTDIGIQQSGIAQQVMDSLSSLPMALWPGFLANIICVGGSSKMVGFIDRLQAEIRTLAPIECKVRVTRPPSPIISTWLGGVNLAKQETIIRELSVTKEEYDEYGAGWAARKFAGI
ncbi:actin-related protein [Blumeria hordei DH14]|uniref:Actin-like protein ARP6 n=1 Tax=Blumeria graminis f. sp. hordei (strain DH14) TaxID=546991 RepID=N1JI29_BLUG1|nr:actin-related protein [Blumeria hordei DH14]